MVTKMRVDNNLKSAKLTASINNHNPSMHTTILCIATKLTQGKWTTSHAFMKVEHDAYHKHNKDSIHV